MISNIILIAFIPYQNLVMVHAKKKHLLMLQVRLLLKNVEFSLKLSKIIIFTLGLCKPKILSESKTNESDELYRPFTQ